MNGIIITMTRVFKIIRKKRKMSAVKKKNKYKNMLRHYMNGPPAKITSSMKIYF